MWTFRAMGTEVTVAAPELAAADEQHLATRVAELFADTERRFSRFRSDSELSVLNAARGSVTVSAELARLLAAAREHAAWTGGLFEPAIGGALEAAGYDQSFAPGRLDRDEPVHPATARFADVQLDESARVVVRPAGVRIDLGGFLKGRTVDRAAALATGSAMIDAGGDARLVGAGPRGRGWLVDVEDPADARRVLVTLRLRDRAVATSAPNRRTWRAGSEQAHHLIDPRTGAPARSDLAQVTAIADTAERADVLAKVAFLLGREAGAAWLVEHGAAGVLVTRDGQVALAGEDVTRA